MIVTFIRATLIVVLYLCLYRREAEHPAVQAYSNISTTSSCFAMPTGNTVTVAQDAVYKKTTVCGGTTCTYDMFLPRRSTYVSSFCHVLRYPLLFCHDAMPPCHRRIFINFSMRGEPQTTSTFVNFSRSQGERGDSRRASAGHQRGAVSIHRRCHTE